jgi:protein TonB
MYGGTRLAGAGRSGLEDRNLRLFAWAVLGSLALHALILLLLSGLQEFVQGRAVAPPLTARLAKPGPPPEPPPEPPKAEPLTQPEQPVVRPAVKPQPLPRSAAAQDAPPVVPAPMLGVEPAKQASEPAFVVPPAPAAPVAPQASARSDPAPASVAVASGPDPGSVARFRLELMEIARRYKRYPRIAQDNNWEGRVELRLAFSESGTMSSLSVKKGSGRAVLDEEAQAMLRSAQPQAVVPPALRGKAFVLEIPVDFSLKEEK